MRYFRSLDQAESIVRQILADDADDASPWFYRIVQCAHTRVPQWVIEVRDEEGTLLGAL
jgi:hypothetical protein